MKKQLFTHLLTVSALTITANLIYNQPTKAQGVTFLCAPNQNGQPTTVARTPQGDVPIITWQTEKGGGWTPEKRCAAVSEKFQDFHARGILKYMTTGRENRQNVICVAQNENGNCLETLYTISDQTVDPGQKLQQLLDVRLQASGPISETNGRIYIDMNQYLRDATAAGMIIPHNKPNIPQSSSNNVNESVEPVNPPEPINNNPPSNNPIPLW